MIQHRLIYSIIDTATSIEKVYENVAELDVIHRNSVDDRTAIGLLYRVIKDQLVPGGGSTAGELRSMTVTVPTAEPADVEAMNTTLGRYHEGQLSDYEPPDQPL